MDKPKKTNGRANMVKGQTYERLWAKRFRELGYSYCRTSRQASRLLDDSKIDLAYVPYNIQCKAVKAGINYSELFKEIKTAIKNNFPPTDNIHKHPIIIAHKKGSKQEEEFVVIQAQDFLEMLKRLK